MLRERLAEHLGVGVDEFEFGECAFADGWDLAFNKRKNDGTAAANIVPREDYSVEGVLYQLLQSQWEKLKKSEGSGYSEKPISVRTKTGKVDAMTLVAVKVTADIQPSRDYLEKIVDGAREHGVSEDYIATVVAKAK